MNRRLVLVRPSPQPPQAASLSIDLERISWRILKLAEIAMLDHMESLEASQAIGLTEAAGLDAPRGRRMRPGTGLTMEG